MVFQELQVTKKTLEAKVSDHESSLESKAAEVNKLKEDNDRLSKQLASTTEGNFERDEKVIYQGCIYKTLLLLQYFHIV